MRSDKHGQNMCRCSAHFWTNKPTAAYSTSGHLAASHYSFSQRGGASQKGTWILTSKVLSQVLEILLNQRKCFVSRLPRNLNKNQGSLKITTANNIKTLTACDCMKYLVFHGSRSLGKASYGFTKASTNWFSLWTIWRSLIMQSFWPTGLSLCTNHHKPGSCLKQTNSSGLPNFHHASLQHTRCTASFSLRYG